jgi:hypothetical protein
MNGWLREFAHSIDNKYTAYYIHIHKIAHKSTKIQTQTVKRVFWKLKRKYGILEMGIKNGINFNFATTVVAYSNFLCPFDILNPTVNCNVPCRLSDQLHKQNGNTLPPFARSHHIMWCVGLTVPLKLKGGFSTADIHLRCFITLMLYTHISKQNNCGTFMGRAKR